MNVHNEAFEALVLANPGCTPEYYAGRIGARLQPKVNALREQLLVHQMNDIEARMYDSGAELPVIQALLGAVANTDLNTRLLVHDGLKAWLDLLDERA